MIKVTTADGHVVSIDGIEHDVKQRHKRGLIELVLDGQTYKAFVKRNSDTHFEIWIKHYCVDVHIEDPRSVFMGRFAATASAATQILIVRAPMPGLVTLIEVAVGDEVDTGTGLVILEAMKMENEIRSALKGKIRSIEVQRNATVEKDQALLIIERIK